MDEVTKDLLEAMREIIDNASAADGKFVRIARAAIARAEAALAEPQPDADGWIPWAGGECPIEGFAAHQVRLRDGTVSEVDTCASDWTWRQGGGEDDIIAYRIVGQGAGQYVTNDASRGAALEQARAEEREACAHEGWMAASWDCEDRVKAAILARGQG